MPLPLPNLDDRTLTDLVAEARAMIPAYAPDWTNHNDSDPGVTLVQLFAYLTEMLMYRVNRITDANRLAFVKLLKGPEYAPSPTETLAEQIRDAVLELREHNRAITCEDFEGLALEADPRVRRARCLPRRDLEAENSGAPATEKPGHVSVIIVPASGAVNPQPDADLIGTVKSDLEPRRLLTTQVHVVGPRYFALGVRLTLVLKPDALEEKFLFTLDVKLQSDLDGGAFSAGLQQAFGNQHLALSPPNVTVTVRASGSRWLITDAQTQQRYGVRLESGALNVYVDTALTAAINALLRYFDPLAGGEDGQGWPFGRNVYVSQVYQLLDTLPGVDYAQRTKDPSDPQHIKELDELSVAPSQTQRLQYDNLHNLIAVGIGPAELIDAQKMEFDLTIISNPK